MYNVHSLNEAANYCDIKCFDSNTSQLLALPFLSGVLRADPGFRIPDPRSDIQLCLTFMRYIFHCIYGYDMVWYGMVW